MKNTSPSSSLVYWILGASSGIGHALALLLAKAGHQIILSARNESALITLHEKISEINPSSHLVIPCDCGSYESLQQAKALIFQRITRIDSVIYLAGQYYPRTTLELEQSEIDEIINTNLKGPMYLTQLMLATLLEQKNSQLMFCASVAGYRGLPNAQPYGASKAGLINFVQSLHAEHSKQLDIKLINPGFVKTPLTAKNNFKMPCLISAQEAAEAIFKSMKSKQLFEIHFPKRFTLVMKVLSYLPYRLYHLFMRR